MCVSIFWGVTKGDSLGLVGGFPAAHESSHSAQGPPTENGKFLAPKMGEEADLGSVSAWVSKSGEMWVLSVLPGKIRTAVNFLPLLDVLVVCWCFPPSLVESPWVIQSCWLLFPRLPQSIGSQGLIRSMPIFEKNGPNMSKQRAAIVPCSRGLVTFDANWVALCSHLRHPCSLATWSPYHCS